MNNVWSHNKSSAYRTHNEKFTACLSTWLINYSLNNSGESKPLKSFVLHSCECCCYSSKTFLCPRSQTSVWEHSTGHAVHICCQLILRPECGVKLCVWLISHGLSIWCSRQVKEAIKQKDDVWSCPDGVCPFANSQASHLFTPGLSRRKPGCLVYTHTHVV